MSRMKGAELDVHERQYCLLDSKYKTVQSACLKWQQDLKEKDQQAKELRALSEAQGF